MTAPSSIGPARFLHEHLAAAAPDLPRSMLTTFINAPMSADADPICGAPYGQSSPERTNAQRLPATGVRHPRRHPGGGGSEAARGLLLLGLAAGAAPPG